MIRDILRIDIETYSSVDLLKSGLYKYVQSPDFEILLFAYAYSDGPVQLIDLAMGEKLPFHVLHDLHRADVIKKAYNAAFEQYCLNKYWETPINQWRCTMARGLYNGYPGSLAAIGNALSLTSDKKKSSEGKALIKYFCKPCAPTKRNGGRTRNLPRHDPAKWHLFREYCRQDVVTEREVDYSLEDDLPAKEAALWEIDQHINHRGAKVDKGLVDGAISISSRVFEQQRTEAWLLTGLENPNSASQLKAWVEGTTGRELPGITKEDVSGLLEHEESLPPGVGRVLQLRQEMSKTSVKKYMAMNAAACEDGRVRGLLQYYGANRTGRWAGRLVQIQNLPRNRMDSLDLARKLVKCKSLDGLKITYGNIPDTLSQLIRTAFIPEPGHTLAVADFSAIEARVIAWIAGEQWRMDVFNSHGKIYEASASTMFGVPLELIQKGNPEYELRSKGKIAELALGYQGATGAMIQMGALDMGLPEEEIKEIVQRWRKANRRIVDLWHAVESRALNCVEYGNTLSLDKGITFSRDRSRLIITLPSGRRLFYNSPAILPNDRGGKSLWFHGVDQEKKTWARIQTYGGKLTENIVQAIARDCLAEALIRLHSAGYQMIFHVHDEVVAEIPIGGHQSLEDMIRHMCVVPEWAPGLPLDADGFTCSYYRKD